MGGKVTFWWGRVWVCYHSFPCPVCVLCVRPSQVFNVTLIPSPSSLSFVHPRFVWGPYCKVGRSSTGTTLVGGQTRPRGRVGDEVGRTPTPCPSVPGSESSGTLFVRGPPRRGPLGLFILKKRILGVAPSPGVRITGGIRWETGETFLPERRPLPNPQPGTVGPNK